MSETKTIFSPNFVTEKKHFYVPRVPVSTQTRVIEKTDASEAVIAKGDAFAKEIAENFVSDFEKSEKLFNEGKVDEKDQMAHVPTFAVIDGMIYTTYYATTKAEHEDPSTQTARLVYCPVDNPDDKTFLDVQTAGDMCYGQKVEMVYDTIFAKKDDKTLFILWTAQVGSLYYRLYREFDIPTKTLGDVKVNRFKVGNITNDFSASGMQNAMAENNIAYKEMYADIGIMQKFSSRVEDGETYYYTGTYSGDFTAIIKSKDFITWEYVAQPGFLNESKWENATYVVGDKCYYFVRQQDTVHYGFLTYYDLVTKTWERPVLIGDCCSRSDFIEYKGDLYLFHAPYNRNHIGVVKINQEDLSKSEVVLQADMQSSCFYPFIQYFEDGELGMAYTISRKNIRLARFTLSKYLD